MRAAPIGAKAAGTAVAETHPKTAAPEAGSPGTVLRTVLPIPEGSDLAPELFDRLRRAIIPGAPGHRRASLSSGELGRLGTTVHAALLDSSDHPHTSRPERSRRSILAFSSGPHALQVRHRSGVTWEAGPRGTVRRQGPFFDWLTEAWPGQGADASTHGGGPGSTHPSEQPFVLGWVGWLGYGLKRETGSPDGEASQREEGAAAVPSDDARLFRATHAVVLDHQAGTAEVQSLGEDSGWVRTVRDALSACTATKKAATAPSSGGWGRSPAVTGLESRDSHGEYLLRIREAQEQIRLGNSYEVCLTTALTGRLSPCDGFSLFRRLRERNRAPFTQYLCFPGEGSEGGVELLSTSPERFLSISAGGLVRSEPIKGTRPRGDSHEEDEHLRQDLLSHPKDRAENVMITDLVRNDLSIHAVPGTLRTERLCAVETYPTVHQMVSTVSSRTSPDVPRASVVAAAFPPGSMTGAPKISTMDILEKLESGPRGPYSGAAGYFSTTGAADLSVLIRTAVLTQDGGPEEEGSMDHDAAEPHGPLLHLGLGGAITADSDPDAEWAEVRAKSIGILSVLEETFPEQ